MDKVYVKTSVLFGVICAALILVYFFASYFLTGNPLLHMSRFDLLIVMVCIFSGMLYYRNMLNAGKMHFWEGLLIGTIINFVGTLLSTVAIYVFIAFLDPEVMRQYILELEKLLIAGRQQMDENLGSETAGKIITNVLATTPEDVALDLFVKKIIICLFATGIIGAFLRKT